MVNFLGRGEARWNDDDQSAETRCAAIAPIGEFVRFVLWGRSAAVERNGVSASAVK